jgi:hypothetical protein
MKITDVESIRLRLPEVREIGDGCQDILIIKVHTAMRASSASARRTRTRL